MSLVAEIINSAKKSNKLIESKGELGVIFSKCDSSVENICKILRSQYVLFSAAIKESENIQKTLDECLDQLNNADKQIQELTPLAEGSAADVRKISSQLNEGKLKYDVTQNFFNIHNLLCNAVHLFEAKQFDDAAMCYKKVDKLMENFPHIIEQMDIAETIMNHVITKRTELSLHTIQEWKRLISISKTEDKFYKLKFSKILQDFQKTSYFTTMMSTRQEDTTTNFSVCGTTQFEEKLGSRKEISHKWVQLVITMAELDQLKLSMHEFSSNLMRHFIVPLVENDLKLSFDETSSEDLCVWVENTSNNNSQCNETVFNESFNYFFGPLRQLFELLRDIFCDFPNTDKLKQYWFMKYLGKEIGEKLAELILNRVKTMVPVDEVSFNTFSTDLSNQMQILQDFLISIEFFESTDARLISGCNDIEKEFHKKKCANLLHTARELMKKGLGITKTIEPFDSDDRILNDLSCVDVAYNIPQFKAEVLQIDTCKVSSSIIELVQLLNDSADELKKSDFKTLKIIMTLYVHVVPTVHQTSIRNNLEQAALALNNSLFLSHHIILLSMTTQNKDESSATPDFTYDIREFGIRTLKEALQKLYKRVTDNIRTAVGHSWLKHSGPIHPLYVTVQESLNDLVRLKIAWGPILPRNIYVRAIGKICECLVKTLVNEIVLLEEISTDSSACFVDVLKLLKVEIPTLFQHYQNNDDKFSEKISDEISKKSKVNHKIEIGIDTWMKMEELILVLDANLLELNERWADGKGPLAHLFSAEEIRQLIRAIFQNTDRRAQLLAKIAHV